MTKDEVTDEDIEYVHQSYKGALELLAEDDGPIEDPPKSDSAYGLAENVMPDRRIDHVEPCPFCDNEPICDCAIMPTKYANVIVGCYHCLAIQENSYKYEEYDLMLLKDLTKITKAQWNDAVLKLKDTDKYKVFLKHKKEYEEEHGEPMPIWYGIYVDYILDNKYDDRTIEKKRDDGIKNGLTKEGIKKYLDDKKRMVSE